MTQKLHTIKTDLHNVFVEGNAADIQMIRIFIMIAAPLNVLFLLMLHY